MSPENLARYNERIDYINSLKAEEIDEMLNAGNCPYPVEFLIGVPLGMFHCELCGSMVVAGLPHGPVDRECRS